MVVPALGMAEGVISVSAWVWLLMGMSFVVDPLWRRSSCVEMGGRFEPTQPLERFPLDLSLSAVDEEFDAGDEARVGGSEEDGGASNLLGVPYAPERDR